MSASEEESRGPVIRDRRRIDPVSGQVRQPPQASGTGQATRGPGQARQGKHSVSKPGSLRQEAAGAGQAAGEAAPESGAAGHGAAGSGQDTADGGQNADAAGGTAGSDGASDLAVKLAERTADLQRLQAEYANYRKRVDRDRTAVRELALASVLIEL